MKKLKVNVSFEIDLTEEEYQEAMEILDSKRKEENPLGIPTNENHLLIEFNKFFMYGLQDEYPDIRVTCIDSRFEK